MTQLEPWVVDSDVIGAVLFRCGCCDAVDWMPIPPAGAIAWVHGRTFSPSVPLPHGWTSVEGGRQSCWQCADCSARLTL